MELPHIKNLLFRISYKDTSILFKKSKVRNSIIKYVCIESHNGIKKAYIILGSYHKNYDVFYTLLRKSKVLVYRIYKEGAIQLRINNNIRITSMMENKIWQWTEEKRQKEYI